MNSYSLLANRGNVLILISKGDASLKLKDRTVSPLALSLKFALEMENINSSICYREFIKNKSILKYNKSIGVFFSIAHKLNYTNDFVWNSILKIANPKFVVGIDWDLQLNRCCNYRKIPIYYFQHGVICADHNIIGWKALKKLANDDFPTAFLCWDKNSAENFSNLFQTFTIGHLWFNTFNATPRNILKEKILSEYDFGNITKSRLPKILLTLTYGNPEIYNIPHEIVLAIKENRNKYYWMIRLHPAQLNNNSKFVEFKDFLDENFSSDEVAFIEWQKTSSYPLPIILNEVDLHLTIESSSVIEASYSGIKSLIYNSKVIELNDEGTSQPPYGGPSYFKYERTNGYVNIWKKGMDLNQWIHDNIQKRLEPNHDLALYKNEWSHFMEQVRSRLK